MTIISKEIFFNLLNFIFVREVVFYNSEVNRYSKNKKY